MRKWLPYIVFVWGVALIVFWLGKTITGNGGSVFGVVIGFVFIAAGANEFLKRRRADAA